MTTKEELHDLVDQLDDTQRPLALTYQQHLRRATAPAPVPNGLAQRMWPQSLDGDAFFGQPSRDLATLAAAQGRLPIADVDEVLGDFWPEDERVDDFIATVRRWRHEGGHA